MSYKSLYKRIGEQIFNVQEKSSEITSWEKTDATANTVDGTMTVVASSVGDSASKAAISHQTALQKDPDTGLHPYVEGLSRFEASLKGLSNARKAIWTADDAHPQNRPSWYWPAPSGLIWGGHFGSKDGSCVLAIHLYTNHGRRLLGLATKNELGAPGKITKDDEEHGQVNSKYDDSPLSKGTFEGFFGRSNESTGLAGSILRLDLIWGDISNSSSIPNASALGATAQAYDYDA
ncbi:hypothetical protein MMC18_001131 [Xylographa bjoerkii]|nr:hypothetical protein [Xylographa bjoerkii]